MSGRAVAEGNGPYAAFGSFSILRLGIGLATIVATILWSSRTSEYIKTSQWLLWERTEIGCEGVFQEDVIEEAEMEVEEDGNTFTLPLR
jgi:hypothetical protein